MRGILRGCWPTRPGWPFVPASGEAPPPGGGCHRGAAAAAGADRNLPVRFGCGSVMWALGVRPARSANGKRIPSWLLQEKSASGSTSGSRRIGRAPSPAPPARRCSTSPWTTGRILSTGSWRARGRGPRGREPEAQHRGPRARARPRGERGHRLPSGPVDEARPRHVPRRREDRRGGTPRSSRVPPSGCPGRSVLLEADPAFEAAVDLGLAWQVGFLPSSAAPSASSRPAGDATAASPWTRRASPPRRPTGCGARLGRRRSRAGPASHPSTQRSRRSPSGYPATSPAPRRSNRPRAPCVPAAPSTARF